MRLLVPISLLAALAAPLRAQSDTALAAGVRLPDGTLARAWLASQAGVRGAERGRVGRVGWTTADSLRFRWEGGFDATTTAWPDVMRLDTLVSESRSVAHALVAGGIGAVGGLVLGAVAYSAFARRGCNAPCMTPFLVTLASGMSIGAVAGGAVGWRAPARREWATVVERPR